MRTVPDSDSAVFKRYTRFVAQFLCHQVPITELIPFLPYVAECNLPQNKKQLLIKAKEALHGRLPNMRKAQVYAPFAKLEGYLDDSKCLRVICAPCTAVKATLGPMMRSIEKVLYKVRNHNFFNLPYFIKDVPIQERAKVLVQMQRPNMLFFATDHTSFEAHISAAIMRVTECALFRHCLPKATALVDWACKLVTGPHTLRTRVGVVARLAAGRRMSGDMHTSLGNGFTNLMCTLFIMHEAQAYGHVIVEGDDGLIASDRPLDVTLYQKLGFTIKFTPVSNLYEASFCGLIFSPALELIRDPWRFIANFTFTHSAIDAGQAVMDSLLRAKALSAYYETPQCPIIGAYARYALTVTAGALPRFAEDGYHWFRYGYPDLHEVTPLQPQDSTRALFCKLYHISPETQVMIEQEVMAGHFDNVAHLIPPLATQAWYAQRYCQVT